MANTNAEIEALLRAIEPELHQRVKPLIDESFRKSVVSQTLSDAFFDREKLLSLPPAEARRRLLAILHNNAKDRGRVETRREQREVPVDDGLDPPAGGGERVQLAAEGPSPYSARRQGEVRDAFWAAVRALPERERQVFELHKWEQIPLTQVAEQLGLTRDEARGALARAVDALEATLPPEVRE